MERTILTHCFPALKNFNAIYKAWGFVIDTIHADEEFQSLNPPLLDKFNILMNIATTNEHVPEIERMIRVVKEHIRSTVHGVPFKQFPIIMKKT